MSNGIHLALAHQETTGDRLGRLRLVLAEVGPACALSSLTTALAFCTILLTGNPQLREFAILGSAGMVLSFGVVLAAFSLLALVLPAGGRRQPRLAGALASGLYRLGRRAPRAMILSAVALTVLGAAGFTATHAWFPLYRNLPDGSPAAAAADRMAEDFGGAFLAYVELDTAGADDLATAAGWQRYARVAAAVEQQGWPTLSLLSMARWLGAPDATPSPDMLGKLPPALAQNLWPSGGGLVRILVMMPEPMRSPETLARYDRFEQAALSAGADRVLGLPAVMRHESVALIRQLSWSLASAAIAATAIVALALRSWRLLPALMLPNVLPVLLCAAALVPLAGARMTPTAALALTIAFGIAVDDTIHFTSRYLLERRRWQDRSPALDAAARRAGPAMALTTLLLLAGLSVTAFSLFPPVRQFGGMMVLALAIALMLDLMLLPALLTLTGRTR